MARWRVDYIGKGGKHLGTVEAPDQGEAIEAPDQGEAITVNEDVPHYASTAVQDRGDEDRDARKVEAVPAVAVDDLPPIPDPRLARLSEPHVQPLNGAD